MLELVLVVLALLALSEPAISIVFALAAVGLSAWKQDKLRRQLRDLAELNVKQNDALHRELLDLKRHVTAAPPIAESAVEARQAAHTVVPAPAQKATPPTAAAQIVHKTAEAAVVLPVPPAIEKKPEVVPVKIEKDAATPAAAEFVVQKPVTPPTVAPLTASPLPDIKPTAPAIASHRPETPTPPSSSTPLPLSRTEMPPSKAPSSSVVPPTRVPAPPPTCSRRGTA